AMPHKRNPISAENLMGVARLLRSYSNPSLENVALWHERDISHSAVERVVFPDAFILLDYAANRMAELLEGLDVLADKMAENIELSQGHLFSSQLLLALIQKGLSREEAYAITQELAHGLKKGEQLKAVAGKDARIKKLLNAKQLDEVFSGKALSARFKEIVAR